VSPSLPRTPAKFSSPAKSTQLSQPKVTSSPVTTPSPKPVAAQQQPASPSRVQPQQQQEQQKQQQHELLTQLKQKSGLSFFLVIAFIFFSGTPTEFSWPYTYDIGARVNIVGSFSDWKEVSPCLRDEVLYEFY
jgi:hypothetical protein